MKNISVLLLFIFNTVYLYSQLPVYPLKGTVKFSFFEGKISDTNKLVITVKYTNRENTTIQIPVNLVEGDKYDPYANMFTELQRFENGKYNKYVNKFVDYFWGDSVPQPIIIYNKLQPGDSAFLRFNLINRTGFFYQGKYRMRVHLLNVPINDPPYVPNVWIVSQWFYFQVVKDMVYPEIYLGNSYKADSLKEN